VDYIGAPLCSAVCVTDEVSTRISSNSGTKIAGDCVRTEESNTATRQRADAGAAYVPIARSGRVQRNISAARGVLDGDASTHAIEVPREPLLGRRR
jgi:hypothetical protein